MLSVVLCGLSLRLYGINFGLPYLYNSDEPLFVDAAMQMLSAHSLNPNWFGVPASTTIYLSAALYSVIFGAGVALGFFANPSDFKVLYVQNPAILYLSGRLIIACFGAATIPLVYMIGRRLFNRWTGVLAAALVALSPVHVYYSKLIRPDVQMSFLTLAAFWFCLKILERPTLLSYVMAGFLIGLGTATKYPAIVVALVIVLAHILSKPQQWSDHAKLLASGLASVVGLFVGSPYLLVKYEQALREVAMEARPSHLSATGEGLIQNIVWYLTGPLSHAVSTAGLLLGVIGIALCVIQKERSKWLLIAFPVIFFLFICSLNLRWERWIVPVIPPLCILSAHTIFRIASRIGQTFKPAIGISTALLLFLGVGSFLLHEDFLQGQMLSAPETRTLARDWIIDTVPQGSRLLVEQHTPQFRVEPYELFEVTYPEGTHITEAYPMGRISGVAKALFIPMGVIGKLKDPEIIRQNKIEYMILSDWYDRYVAEQGPAADPHAVATYEALMRMGTKIYETHSVFGQNDGPTIRIYRFNSVD